MLPAGSPLSDWLTWLETLSPNEIEMGLDRVRIVLDRLSMRQPRHTLLVAGTNGKGILGRDAVILLLLRATGHTIGAYTSPHVSRYNERIAVNGVPTCDEDIVADIRGASRPYAMDVPLTYFEYGTLAAMRYSREPRSTSGYSKSAWAAGWMRPTLSSRRHH